MWLQKATAPKLVRWRLRLQEFDFTIRHLPGKFNVVADALSRLHDNGDIDKTPFVGVCSIALAMLAADSKSQLPFVATSTIPDHLDAEFVSTDGPISMFHGRLCGHFGINETVRRMQDCGIVHDRLREHVDFFIKSCPLCQKLNKHKPSVPERISTIAVSEIGAEWSVDVIGPLEPDEDGNKYVIALIDSFSRFLMLKAAKDTAAMTFAKFLLEVSGIFNLPTAIRCDNSSEFVNALINALLQLLGIQHQPSIPYRPQSNGGIERSIKEIIRHLSFCLIELRRQGKWSGELPTVQRLMNTSFCAPIGTTPARLVFGDLMDPSKNLLHANYHHDLS